jgi:hypothetical protein
MSPGGLCAVIGLIFCCHVTVVLARAVTSGEIEEQESLKDANKWDLLFGAASNYNYGESDGGDDYWYWQLFTHHFGITTAENGCKMKQGRLRNVACSSCSSIN